jgi:hypothetical protein
MSEQTKSSIWRSLGRLGMVVVRLGAGHARLAWSKTPMPALTNLAELVHASAFAGVDRQRILHDDSAPTELERADGNWGAVARRLGAAGSGTGAKVASLASEIDRHLSPMNLIFLATRFTVFATFLQVFANPLLFFRHTPYIFGGDVQCWPGGVGI